MRFQDEIDCTEKRRSRRIIDLEEKKQQEKERNLALASERNSNSVNHDIKVIKGKGKEIMVDLSDFNENEESPIKNGGKSKELDQLISSIKELEKHNQNDASVSRINDSSLNGMSLKCILENIIDFIQRKDMDELFAEPANLDVMENYHEIVKQPMDFATMRAKLHEGMYTNLYQFKRDILLICSNAMNATPKTSKYHLVAEDISRHAKWIFEALNSEPSSLIKRGPPSRKQQNEQFRTPGRVATKRAGRNNANHSTVPETEKRVKYWPPSMPLVAEVLNADKAFIQLNEKESNYKESLLRFVKDLGPIAQRIAAKKLEAVSSVENVSSLPVPVQEHTNRLHLGGNRTSNTRQWNISAGVQNMLATGARSSSNVFSRRINPTSMMISGNRNSLSGSSLMPHPCLVPQPRPQNSIPCMPRNNLTLRPMQQLRPEGTSNLSKPSLVAQPRPENSMPFMPRNNLTLRPMHQLRSEGTSNLSKLSLVAQPRPRESMYVMPSNNLTEVSHMPRRADSMSSMNPLRLSPHEPVLQQKPNSSFLQMVLGSETNNYGGGGALIGQPEEAPPQLPLDNDNDQELDLDLHL